MRLSHVLLTIALFVALPVQAERVINSVTLNGAATTTVTPGSTVAVEIVVSTTGSDNNDNWDSTSYTLNGVTTCVNTSDYFSDGTYTETFTITAPVAEGNYNISFYAHRNGGCAPPSDSNNFTLSNGIEVSTGGGGSNSCASVFPDGVSSNNSSGSIQFGFNSRTTASPDNVLDTTNLIDGSFGSSCDTTSCNASNNVVPALSYNSFPGGTNVSIGFASSQTLSPGDYGSISTGAFSSLTLTPGDYTVSGNLSIGFLSQLLVSGAGTVRLFVDGAVTFSSSATINNGSASQLVVYANSTISLTSPSTVNGFLYSNSNVTIGSSSTVTGAVTASNITLSSPSRVNYDSAALEVTDFGSLCDDLVAVATPVAEYQFDEFVWTGTASEVIDSSGNNYNGTALQTEVDTIEDGLICRAGNFPDITSDTSYAVDTGLVVSSDIGNAGSISIWHRSAVDWSSTSSDKTLWDASSAGSDNKYFYLILLADGRLRFGQEDSSDGDFRITTTTAAPIAADEWGHVVVVWDVNGSEQGQIWVNGVQQAVNQGNDTLNGSALGNSYSLYIGDNRSSYNPQGSDRAAAGDIDEVLVFDQALNSFAINEIYSLQLNGQNLDGSERRCPYQAVAEYFFEETNWNGTLGEVVDSSGNNLNGQAVNGVSTAISSPAPARYNPGDNTGTCRYGNLSGNAAVGGGNGYIAIADNDLLDISDELTITAWIHPRSLPSSDLMTILSKDENYEFHINGSAQINWWWNNASGSTQQFSTTGTALVEDTWYHIAIVYTDGAQSIYIDGVERGTATFTGGLLTNTDPLLIGTDINFVGSRNFNGPIDEVKIFNRALTVTEVNAIYQETHPCAQSPVDHYDIDHALTYATCEAATVTVTAHDASHGTVDVTGRTIDVSTSTTFGNWSLAPSATGSLSGVGPGVASYTFGSGEQQVALYLSHTVAANDIDIDVNDSGITDLDGDVIEDPNINFVEAALRFYADGVADVIGNQIANKDSDVAPDAQNLTLRAVRTNTDTGACEAALQGDQTVRMAYRCVNPSSCIGGESLELAATTLAANPSSGALTYSDVNLTFNASGEASLNALNYSDAGTIRLYAQTDVPADPPNPAVTIEGTSNLFVVRPVGFCVQAQDMDDVGPGTPDCTIPTVSGCLAYVAAASNFNVDITAVAWESDGDIDYCRDNSITPNYVSSNIVLNHNLVAPIDGETGDFTPTEAQTITSGLGGSITIASAQISEVGVFTITATDNNYASQLPALVIAGTSANIGRFIPQRFNVIPSAMNPVSPAYASGVTYFGQPFEVNYRVEALNADNEVTVNYDSENGFANHNPNNEGQIADGSAIQYGAIGDNGAVQLYNTRIEPTNSPGGRGWLEGQLLINAWQLQINRDTSPDVPAENVEIGVYMIDGDDVESLALDLDTSNSGLLDSVKLGDLSGRVYYGRAFFPPVYGPEIYADEETPIPFVIQYWDGAAFITNTSDSDSPYDGWVEINCSDGTVSCSDTPLDSAPAGAVIIDGRSNRQLSIDIERPGYIGQRQLQIDVDDWLQTVSGNEPTTTITFGTYRGHDRIIYWREVH